MFSSLVFNTASYGVNIFGGIGAALLLAVSYLHWKGIYDSKNTTGLINKFLIFSCVTATLFIIAGFSSMAGGTWNNGLSWSTVVGNACSFTANFLVWQIKRANVKAACKAGLSEQDYYSEHIAPNISIKPVKESRFRKSSSVVTEEEEEE